MRGLPAYPVGMVLLARLAVDRREQGSGLGGTLLAAALRKAVAAGEAAAARLVVVDAIDENAARFYERYGFIPAPEHRLRLYRRMKDIVRSLDGS
jgi:predicted N-acetyltransferase YhbS